MTTSPVMGVAEELLAVLEAEANASLGENGTGFVERHIKEKDTLRAELEAQVEAYLSLGGTITPAEQPEPRPAKSFRDVSEAMYRARETALEKYGKRILQECIAGRGIRSIAYDLRMSHSIVSWVLSQLKAQGIKASPANVEAQVLAEIAEAEGAVIPRDIARNLRARGLRVTYSDVDRIAALNGFGERVEV